MTATVVSDQVETDTSDVTVTATATVTVFGSNPVKVTVEAGGTNITEVLNRASEVLGSAVDANRVGLAVNGREVGPDAVVEAGAGVSATDNVENGNG